MRIESVRSLKQEIRERVLGPLVNSDLERRRLGVRTLRLDRSVLPKTIALGISRGTASAEAYQLAVRVQHPLLWDAPEVQSIRDKAMGEVDIRFIGYVHPLQAPWYQEQCTPLRMGCTIGHYLTTAGSLGAFVKDRTTGAIQILSNNHVLANENQGEPGDDILQPGKYDHGRNPTDAVGTLNRFVPIEFGSTNLVDCALAHLPDTTAFDAETLDTLGKLTGGRGVPLIGGESVYKIGRTTGLTKGAITAVEVDNITVTYNRGSALFDSQIEIQGSTGSPFAVGGDSGSLVIDESHLAVGLLFGGTLQGGPNNSGLVYANHIDAVLNQLNVDLIW